MNLLSPVPLELRLQIHASPYFFNVGPGNLNQVLMFVWQAFLHTEPASQPWHLDFLLGDSGVQKTYLVLSMSLEPSWST